ncbi:MAG: tetratricopeptide repeat protein, partial [Desulfomonilaceae bacterium]
MKSRLSCVIGGHEQSFCVSVVMVFVLGMWTLSGLGIAAAQNYVGKMYADVGQSLHSLMKAADQGDADAQFSLGWKYYNGQGVPKDQKKAAQWYRRAAQKGHSGAQCNLGVMYDNGTGVAKDETEAVKWFKKAADQGYADAQNNLGAMYQNGRGLDKDAAEAMSISATATASK